MLVIIAYRADEAKATTFMKQVAIVALNFACCFVILLGLFGDVGHMCQGWGEENLVFWTCCFAGERCDNLALNFVLAVVTVLL